MKLLEAVTRRLRELGLATGEQGFNLDFHAIRHHGDDTPLEKHYVPRRSQRTRSVLTFFAQDHASQEMVYANADLTKAEQAREVLAFADYWQKRLWQRPRAARLRLQADDLHRPRRALHRAGSAG